MSFLSNTMCLLHYQNIYNLFMIQNPEWFLLIFYMQGEKEYSEKLFLIFQLSYKVPEHNFYRNLKSILDFKVALCYLCKPLNKAMTIEIF